MYTTSGIAIVTLIAAGLVAINILLHYEALNGLSKALAKLAWVGRPRVALLMGALLLIHIAEIWIFAGGIMFAEWYGGLGDLKGDHSHGILDYVYYSSMTYTTVGYSPRNATHGPRAVTILSPSTQNNIGAIETS